jgi:hypothetical protein
MATIDIIISPHLGHDGKTGIGRPAHIQPRNESLKSPEPDVAADLDLVEKAEVKAPAEAAVLATDFSPPIRGGGHDLSPR